MLTLVWSNPVLAGTVVPFDRVSELAVEGVKAPMGFLLDDYGRPLKSHLFVTSDTMNQSERDSDTPSPIHLKRWLVNKKVSFEGSTPYLWNRGHLVGYQFGDVESNDPKNITPMTDYLNRHLMLHYEGNRSKADTLAGWLARHPSETLEYVVEAFYSHSEDTIPTKVVMGWRSTSDFEMYNYVDLPSSGLEGDSGVQRGVNGWSYVILENIQPGYEFSYVNGLIGDSTIHSGDVASEIDLSQRFGNYDATIRPKSDKESSDVSEKEESKPKGLNGFVIALLPIFAVLIIFIVILDEK